MILGSCAHFGKGKTVPSGICWPTLLRPRFQDCAYTANPVKTKIMLLCGKKTCLLDCLETTSIIPYKLGIYECSAESSKIKHNDVLTGNIDKLTLYIFLNLIPFSYSDNINTMCTFILISIASFNEHLQMHWE